MEQLVKIEINQNPQFCGFLQSFINFDLTTLKLGILPGAKNAELIALKECWRLNELFKILNLIFYVSSIELLCSINIYFVVNLETIHFFNVESWEF